MLAALEAKFAPNTAVAAALVKSGDAFLLDTSEALELDTEDLVSTLLMVSQFFFFRLLPPHQKKSILYKVEVYTYRLRLKLNDF